MSNALTLHAGLVTMFQDNKLPNSPDWYVSKRSFDFLGGEPDPLSSLELVSCELDLKADVKRKQNPR